MKVKVEARSIMAEKILLVAATSAGHIEVTRTRTGKVEIGTGNDTRVGCH